jgi:hypothetical protein
MVIRGGLWEWDISLRGDCVWGAWREDSFIGDPEWASVCIGTLLLGNVEVSLGL